MKKSPSLHSSPKKRRAASKLKPESKSNSKPDPKLTSESPRGKKIPAQKATFSMQKASAEQVNSQQVQQASMSAEANNMGKTAKRTRVLGMWLRGSLSNLPKSFIAFSLLGAIIAAASSAFIFSSIYNLSGIKSLEQYKPSVITRVYDTKGRLINEFYKERRELVAYRNISPEIIKSLLATEDRRFFSHFGIDPLRIAKAIMVNVLAMRKEQGGSTLTIQLSKLLFLDYQKTFERKIKEFWYGVQIEKQYSKQEILSFYLNELNYGHGSYGVEAAAEYFFGRSARNVNLGEAALLAAIPKSPKYYSPIRYRENAMRRHRIVLTAMVDNAYISNEDAYSAYQRFWKTFLNNLRTRESTLAAANGEAPYFTEYIREKLERDLSSQEIYQEGLRVYTTLDLDHQRSARLHVTKAIEAQNRFYQKDVRKLPEQLGRDVITRLAAVGEVMNIPALKLGDKISEGLYDAVIENELKPKLRNLSIIHGFTPVWNYAENPYANDILEVTENTAEGAFLSMEPRSGYITAMIGGNNFNYYNQFNRAMLLRRQIGSTLKPFVYGVAIERDILTASTLLQDVPIAYGNYIPKNYSGRHYGDVLVRDALKRSINVLAVETAHRTGIGEMRRDLSKIFLAVSERSQKEMFPEDLTFALGSGSFSPLTLTTAYAVLANEGRKVLPRTIRYITDNNGEMIKNYEADYLDEKETTLLSRETAFIIADIIKDVFRPGGTAFIPRLLEDFEHVRKSFGKTGTTSNWTDAWFAGANKALAAVVWIGYDDNRSLGQGRTGGGVAAPVWIRFQKDVLNDHPVEDLSEPKGIVSKQVCRQLGTLAGPYTRRGDAYEEYFKVGTAPTTICTYRQQELEQKENFTQYVSQTNKEQSRSQLQLLKSAIAVEEGDAVDSEIEAEASFSTEAGLNAEVTTPILPAAIE